MNDLGTIVSFFSAALDIIPKAVEVGNRVDELNREHQEKMNLKYSQQEYLKVVLSLYKSRKITAEEAKKTLALIFRDDDFTVYNIKRSQDIEGEIYKLLG